MSYEAPCPACGAALVFRLGASLLRVCEHCGVAVARKGADLASYGRVAELLPTPSVLKLGIEGDYEGAPPFTLVGRLQLDYGAGTWDEWLMAFQNDTWAWLSESQGKFHYMGQAALPPAPAFGDLRVGTTVDLGPPGTFVVAEVRTARFLTGAGELPFDVKPGSLLHYADLSGPGGQFATLDYGTGSTAEALYVGREISLDALGFKGLPTEEERRKVVAGQALSCTQCGGPLEVRAPDQTQRIACPYCGSLLDATKGFAVLEALARPPVKPRIPLGSKGRLSGVEWTVIGFLERSATVEGTRYPWHEYLLYEPRKGFRWLVSANGHWSFVEPAHTGDVHESYTGRAATYEGRSFSHFQSSVARVDHVLGEFYWAVARGDEAETADYVSPPHMLSMEKANEEVNWSFGTYLEPDEVWTAFGLEGSPPERLGVGMNQPWPRALAAKAIWWTAIQAASVVLLLFLWFAMAGGKKLHEQTVTIPAGTVSGSPEAAAFAGPIFVLDTTNVQVRLKAPVSNTWLYVDGALINEETGAVDEFDMDVEYYFGSDSDGSWSEGGQQATRYLSAVPPGRYVLRLAPQWEAGHAPPTYDVSVRARVPRFYQFVLAVLALLAWPLLLAWSRMRFEYGRWSESDHPWMESK